MDNPRKRVMNSVALVVEALKRYPPWELVNIDDALKMRDRREPGRREKELAEDRIMSIVRRIFRKQRAKIQAHLEYQHPDRKAASDYDGDLEPDEEEIVDLVLELKKAVSGGIGLAVSKLKLPLETATINIEALEWAKKYAGTLIKEINKTSIDAVRRAIAQFIETPGMTIGDIMDMLPFNADRALRIAVTEVTRAYAEGNHMAGKELQKQYPGVKVMKKWFTNNDDLVCDICAPLDGMEVEIDESFTTEEDKSEGLDKPPAHINCRCWTEEYTALAEL